MTATARTEDPLAAPTDGARSELGERLKALRQAAGYATQEEFAERLGDRWGQSKISRIERGKQIPTRAEIQDWVTAAGAGRAEVKELIGMLERATAEHKTFRALYAEAGGAAGFQEVIAGRESAAKRIGTYEPILIPGILQTPEYAREMLHLPGGPAAHGASADDIARMIAIRQQRQALLHAPGRDIKVVLSEAALRTRVASPATMRAQCEHIGQLAETLTTAIIGVIPFTAQVPIATLHAWSLVGNLVTIETEEREDYVADPPEVERYWERTRLLLEASVTGRQAAELCRKVARETRAR